MMLKINVNWIYNIQHFINNLLLDCIVINDVLQS